jgi:5'-deoxynucleotidase YfbR-like HD superfamily hydrolase
MANNILDFLKRTNCLSDIDRCSNTSHIKPYPVAVHSYYIALYSMVFADIENERIKSDAQMKNGDVGILTEFEIVEAVRDDLYDMSVLLQKALLHDLEESETGDILFPLHDENPAFKKALDDIRKKCVDTIVFKELPDKVRNCYIRLWHESKDDTKEGVLIAAMDKFEILMYALREIELGNRSIRNIYNNAMKILRNNFDIPSLTTVLSQVEREYGLVFINL